MFFCLIMLSLAELSYRHPLIAHLFFV